MKTAVNAADAAEFLSSDSLISSHFSWCSHSVLNESVWCRQWAILIWLLPVKLLTILPKWKTSTFWTDCLK